MSMKHVGKIIFRTIVISGVLLMCLILGHYVLNLIIDLLDLLNDWVNQLNIWLDQTLSFIKDEKNFLIPLGIIFLICVILEFVGGILVRIFKSIRNRFKRWSDKRKSK